MYNTLSLPMTIPEMRRIKRIHFIGIGGAGMGGIAEVLLTQGYIITGSDLVENDMTQRLVSLGAQLFIGHRAEHIQAADVVVISSAISLDNPERLAALERRIPIVPRAEMLAELMRFRHGIAIAGTHGKTTTTSLLASLLGEAGYDPTFVIGGVLNSTGSNARLGASRYLVAEADESDSSFLHLNPMVSIITNIDADHMGTYQNNFELLKKTFLKFIAQLPFYGLVVVCLDCPVIRSLLKDIKRPVITYGFSEEADFQITDYQPLQHQSYFVVKRPQSDLAITLNLPGRHNALNATAAMIVSMDEGVSDKIICKTFSEFKGIGRRFDIYGEFKLDSETSDSNSIMLVDDYGHHPAEVRETIRAARQGWPHRRLVMAFQPHRYSRTRDLFEDFVEVLSEVDVLFLLEVYSAGEEPIVGVNSQALCDALEQYKQISAIYVNKVENLKFYLDNVLKPGDILLTQGAGNIGTFAQDWVPNR